jgi:ABC-type phosphate/phosphonate transport system substrate-binding protein
MAKFAHSDTLDQGPNLIKTAATKMLLISAYTAGDSYATVTTNTLATVTMTSSDYALSSSGNNKVLTVASGKSATATAGASGTPDLHIAFTDGTSRVLWVTDETSNQAITVSATINFPSGITYTTQQPT